MADHLTKAALSLTLLLAATAQAQGLPDPTLLPAGLGTSSADAGSGNPLQSIILSNDRKIAVISGREVKLGGMIGDARLVAISPTQVTLRRGNAVEILKLHEGIEKLPPGASSRQDRTAAAGSQTRGEKR